MARSNDQLIVLIFKVMIGPFVLLIGLILWLFRGGKKLNDKRKDNLAKRAQESAQAVVYSGSGTTGGTRVGHVEANRVFSGSGVASAPEVGYIDGNKIYRGSLDSSGTQIGHFDGTKIFSGVAPLPRQLGYLAESRIYVGDPNSGGRQIGYLDGTISNSGAAAALLLLLS